MKNLNIIIEGPDNVGKSTLIQNIKNHFNYFTFHTLHYSAIKHNSNVESIQYSKKLYEELFNIMILNNNPNSGIICDRAHLGEMVYGPIYRNYSGDYVLDIEKNNITEELQDSLVLVTCYDEPENLINRDDGLSFSTNINTKRDEINRFKDAHFKSIIKRKILLNIKNYNEEQALLKVIQTIEKGTSV